MSKIYEKPIVKKFFDYNLGDTITKATEYASQNKLRIVSLSHSKEEDGYYVVIVCENNYD